MLFITLYAKALDYRSGHSILHDQAADNILRSLDIDPSKYKGYGHEIIVVRARQLDRWTTEFLRKAGLDQRSPPPPTCYDHCGRTIRISRGQAQLDFLSNGALSLGSWHCRQNSGRCCGYCTTGFKRVDLWHRTTVRLLKFTDGRTRQQADNSIGRNPVYLLPTSTP